MKIGDLVWSVHLDSWMRQVVERRLAIIIDIEPRGNKCYTIQLVACGEEWRTSKKYLQSLEEEWR